MTNFILVSLLALQIAAGRAATSFIVAPAAPRIEGVYTKHEMIELLRQWRAADGDAVLVLSDRLAFFLTGNPQEFCLQMARHPKQLESWLARLGGTTFTDYGGCINRSCLRKQMIDAIESVKNPTRSAEATRLKILVALRNTDIHAID
jgi:hypothetical protein